MRIVICTSSFIREGGGISAYTQDVSEILAYAGHDIMVISTESNMPQYWQLNDKIQIKAFGINIPFKEEQQIASAKVMFEHIVSFDPEVIISSDHIWATSLFPCFADNRIKIAISHFLDGPIALSAVCRPEDTDWIVAVSEAGRGWLINNTNVLQEQVKVIYNTISNNNKNNPEINKSEDDKTVLTIVYPGGGKAQKGADIVLEIIGYLVETKIKWKILWLGPINFIKHFIPKKCMDNIFLIGSVSRGESVKYISQSDFLLLPSRGEGCPISLLEAMKAGTIPIVSDCPSAMKEIIVNGVNGFIFPLDNAKTITEYLKKFISSTESMKSLIYETKKHFNEKLSPAEWLKQMTELMTNKRDKKIKSSGRDNFDPSLLIPWHRPTITWKKPSLKYIVDRTQLMKHALRCAINNLKIRKSLYL
jgi:glycosyltransferase involved in cell wall biosynthesis